MQNVSEKKLFKYLTKKDTDVSLSKVGTIFNLNFYCEHLKNPFARIHLTHLLVNKFFNTLINWGPFFEEFYTHHFYQNSAKFIKVLKSRLKTNLFHAL